MPNLMMSKQYTQQNLQKDVRALAFQFLNKLCEDDTSPGLHIEPINNSVDRRVRTGRVNQQYRAVLYKLENHGGEPTYLLAGIWNHDDAIDYAERHSLRTNPVNGVFELIETAAPAAVGVAPIAPAPATVAKTDDTPVLTKLGYLPSDLIDGFGFSPRVADFVFDLATESEVRAFARTLSTAWHADVLDGMLAEMSVQHIQESLDLLPENSNDAADASEQQPGFEHVAVDTPAPEPHEDDDQRILEALQHPAARAQWRLIENDEELRDIIELGDMAGWRVFLHPEQRRYVERDYNGPFRLTGGAGTGKTVVLLHRARYLARRNPEARIVLTTFTRQLAANLERDLQRLDASIRIAGELGEPGVLIRGIDQLAVAVRKHGSKSYSEAGRGAIGEEAGTNGPLVSDADEWEQAAEREPGDLPAAVRSAAFLEAEYVNVVLPNRITTRDDFLTVRRPGRGVALDRAKRNAVWAIIERRRRTLRLDGKLTFKETAEVAAHYLDQTSPLADHVLVDEGQDLAPSHWKLLRALVAPGQNDIFLAEDSHQRIYGHPVVLSRLGIAIRGRSRRLELNYRTTAENLRFAFAALQGGVYLDPEGDAEAVVGGYRSARTGPAPRVVAASSMADQAKVVAEVLREWIDAGVDPASIAVVTAARPTALHDRLLAADVPVGEPKNDVLPAGRIAVLTMHKAKGLEFSRVIVFDISAGSFPVPASVKNLLAEELQEAETKARSLLYVAASRARDELVVSYQGAPSDVARDLLASATTE
ncbi:UvrD-helicase domain-containing protein [Salinibacterium sp. ZJ70]|uniref:UvrD-helicase domain-containing protein n=1 Tax=Salinibacterium sp. ZJ70 TaxID=2708084 RepID=UPI001421D94C|nr:UvrD-helicase domain-containing protein [Salinibacterium sp. ZJ70]